MTCLEMALRNQALFTLKLLMNPQKTSTALLVSSVLYSFGLYPSYAQDGIELSTITVDGEGSDDDVNNMVAKRSQGASKTDTALIETPQAVSVITRKQMNAQGANTVAEALRYTPGVFADPNGYDTRYDWLYIRGFNTYGTMWLDGLAVAGDPLNYATPTINPYALERIEVIKGPASVLYGRTIPGGLVNQVSKHPETTPHREVNIGSSAFGGIQSSFDFTGPLTQDGEWSYRLLGQGRNLQTQIDHERDRQIMIAPSLTWAPTQDTSLTVYGYYQHDKPIFNPRFYPAYGTLLPNPDGQIPRDVFLGDPNWGGFKRDYYHLGYALEHQLNDNWSLRQNLRYGRSSQNMDLVLVNPAFSFSGAPGSTLDRVTAISDDWTSTFSVDTQAEAKFDTGAFDHTVLFGVDYVRGVSSTNFGNTGWGVSVPGIDYLNPVYGLAYPIAPVTISALQKQSQLGLYVQDQIRYDQWVGTFGLRYDRSEIDTTDRMQLSQPTVSTRDNALTGRAGLTYLFDNGLAPYVSYSTSFLPLMGTDTSGKAFEAQTADQIEVGIKYEPAGGDGMLSLSVFQLTQDNSLTPAIDDLRPTNPTRFTQGGKQRVRGFEAEGKYALTAEFTVLAAYAYSHSEVLSSNNPYAVGQEMLRLPEHQGSAWLTYTPHVVQGLALSAGVRATSSYQTDAGYSDKLRIPSRAMVDLGMEYNFGALKKEFEGTKLRVNVTNLFDKKYVSHCLNITGGSCNYGAGRAITANLKYEW